MGGDVASTPQTTTYNKIRNSSSIYANALTSLVKQLTFYRKALKKLSKTLVEAVFELWKDRGEEIKKVEPIQTPTPNESDFFQERRHPLPADQPTIESFWQTSPTQITFIPTPTKTPHHDKSKQPIRQKGRLQRHNIKQR